MSRIEVYGCEAFRRLVYSAGWDALTLRLESVRLHTRLWRCDVCGAFWEENEREAHVASDDAAMHMLSEADDPAG